MPETDFAATTSDRYRMFLHYSFPGYWVNPAAHETGPPSAREVCKLRPRK